MQTLLELQRRCYDAFVLGRTGSLAHHVAGTDPAGAIGIYQNNALELFRKTLCATYPVVLALTGEACFRTLSRDYMRAHPSSSGNLERFGCAFPGFLADQYGATQFAFLADVARLEWAREEAWVAADGPVIDTAALATVPSERVGDIVFRLHASCRLVCSPYPIFAIWRANTPPADGDVVHLDAGAEQVLVGRGRRQPELHRLERGAAAFVQALLDGTRFAPACEAATAADPAFEPGTVLLELAAWRLLTEVILPDPSTPSHTLPNRDNKPCN